VVEKHQFIVFNRTSDRRDAFGIRREFPAMAGHMEWKQKFQGSLLAFIGFMLSPLSWWNDAFVNLPLALGFGWLVARVYQPAFESSVILGYWLTNVPGFVLLRKGAQKIVTTDSSRTRATASAWRCCG